MASRKSKGDGGSSDNKPTPKRRNRSTRQPINAAAAAEDRSPVPPSRAELFDRPVVEVTREITTPQELKTAENRRRKAAAAATAGTDDGGVAPAKSGKKDTRTKTQRLIDASRDVADSPADIKEAAEVKRVAAASSRKRAEARPIVDYSPDDEALGVGEGSAGGMTILPSGEILGGSVVTERGRGVALPTLEEYGIDENDPLGPYGTGLTPAEEEDYAYSMRDPVRRRTPEEVAQEDRVSQAMRETRRQRRIAGAGYKKRRVGQGEVRAGVLNPELFLGSSATSTLESGPGGLSLGVVQPTQPLPLSESESRAVRERMPSAPDVPMESTTVESLQRRQNFYMGGGVEAGDFPIRTGNPPMQGRIVPDPTKASGMRPELQPIPTPQSRESIDRAYIADVRDALNMALEAKAMAEGVAQLDVERADMPRVFDPSTAGKEESRLEVGETPEGQPELFTVRKRRTGAMRRPSRRQALDAIRDVDPARYSNLLRSLSATGIPSSTGQRQTSLSRIVDMPGSTSMSPQFLGAIEKMADIYNTNLELSQTEAGRRQLIERGARIVSGERDKAVVSSVDLGQGKKATSKLPIRYGGLPTIEGMELGPYRTASGEEGEGILDPEAYAAEVERVAKSPDIGFSVTPYRRASAGDKTPGIAGPQPVSASGETPVPTEETLGKVPQEALDAWMAKVTETQGPAVADIYRQRLVAARTPRVGVPTTTRRGETTTDVGGTTLRDVINANFADVARSRGALARAAQVPGADVAVRGGRPTSAKAQLVTGGEAKLQEFIESDLMQPPVSGAPQAGDALRAGAVSDVGMNPNFIITSEGVRARRGVRRELLRGDKDRFAKQTRGLNDPAVGPIPFRPSKPDFLAQSLYRGVLNPVQINPGGTISAPNEPEASVPIAAAQSVTGRAGRTPESIETWRQTVINRPSTPARSTGAPGAPIERTLRTAPAAPSPVTRGVPLGPAQPSAATDTTMRTMGRLVVARSGIGAQRAEALTGGRTMPSGFERRLNTGTGEWERVRKTGPSWTETVSSRQFDIAPGGETFSRREPGASRREPGATSAQAANPNASMESPNTRRQFNPATVQDPRETARRRTTINRNPQ